MPESLKATGRVATTEAADPSLQTTHTSKTDREFSDGAGRSEMAQGVPKWRSWWLALSGKGWWRMSGTAYAKEVMSMEHLSMCMLS